MKSADLPSVVRAFAVAREGLAGGIVAAVSGGPDSIALWRALSAALPTTRIIVAHLNHGLRGADADADEAFVLGLAGAEVVTARRDVAAVGGNVEAAARRVRYAWLAEVAREVGCRWVATGHTADDQAETILHRLLRGTGLDGLRGIAAARPLSAGITLVRPLLTVNRADVLAFLTALDQPFCHDRTNDDPRRTRNRIRHELLPLLRERYNPRAAEALARLAEQAAAATAVLDRAAAEVLTVAERPRAGRSLVFAAAVLSAADRVVVRQALRIAWRRERWPERGMGAAEWDRLTAVAVGELSAADLPGGVRIDRRGSVVRLMLTRDSGPNVEAANDDGRANP